MARTPPGLSVWNSRTRVGMRFDERNQWNTALLNNKSGVSRGTNVNRLPWTNSTLGSVARAFSNMSGLESIPVIFASGNAVASADVEFAGPHPKSYILGLGTVMCGFIWAIKSCTGLVRCELNLRYWFADQSFCFEEGASDDMVRADDEMHGDWCEMRGIVRKNVGRRSMVEQAEEAKTCRLKGKKLLSTDARDVFGVRERIVDVGTRTGRELASAAGIAAETFPTISL
jgi:hypothetical protein